MSLCLISKQQLILSLVGRGQVGRRLNRVGLFCGFVVVVSVIHEVWVTLMRRLLSHYTGSL